MSGAGASVAANLPLVALALAVLLAVAGFVTWRVATRGLAAAASAVIPPAATSRAAPWRAQAVTAAAGVERSVARFVGDPARARRTPMVALVGAPGAGAASVALAASAGAPAGLTADAPRGSGWRVAMTARGAVLDFGDDLLAQPDWRGAWRSALRGLTDARRDRPLEGLVFAVRSAVLTGLAAEGPAAVIALGERLGALVEEAQAATGLRLPVFLLVSAVDADPAFAALGRIAAARGEPGAALGWSSPHHPEAAFELVWIDQAFETIAASLDRLALAALASSRGAQADGDSQALLGLSAHARALAAPVRQMVGAMLRPTAFVDPAMLRGVYLVGGAEGSEKPAPFAQTLFDRKILPEAALARPAQGRLTRRARQAGRLRLATLALAGLAALGLGALARDDGAQDDLRELLVHARTSLAENRAAAVTPQDRLERQTRQLFADMAALTANDIETPLAPTTYLTRLERRVEAAMGVALDQIALKAFRGGLERTFDAIIADATRLAPLDIVGIEKLAGSLRDYDGYIIAYNSLRTSRSADGLADLSRFAIGFTPPAGFDERYELYVRALSGLRSAPITGEAKAREIGIAVGGTMRDVFDGVYRRSALHEALNDISQNAQWLLSSATPEDAMVAPRLGALMGGIDRAQALMADPTANWLDAEDGPFAQRLDAAAKVLGSLSFAPPGLAAVLDAERRTSHARVRAELLAMPGFGGRGVLAQGRDGATLDPLYPGLRDAVGALMGPGWLSAGAAPAPQADGVARFGWSAARLREAGDAAGWLLTAFSTSGDALPADLRERLIGVARVRAGGRIESLILQARQPLGGAARFGDVGGEEARAFAAAAPLLSELREQVEILGLDGPRRRLAETAGAQARRLLLEADAALDRSGAYEPFYPGIDGWAGGPRLGPAAFGVSGDAALAGLVREWRGFVQGVAEQQAAPALAYLSGGRSGLDAAAAGAAGRWRDILATLADYDARSPRNALSELERFIVVDLAELTIEDCAQRLAAARPGAGWFGERMLGMVIALQGRCEMLGSSRTLNAQGELAEAFNATLAGRFPFIGVGAGAPLLDPARAAQSAADAETVRRFFGVYGERLSGLAAQAGAAGASSFAAADSSDFTARLEAVRQFLTGPGGQPPPGGPAYALGFTFRTNRAAEVAAEQIVEWSVQVGDQRLSSFEPARSLVWRQGEPITLSLRWARNAPNLPQAPRRSDATLVERTLSLRYADPWALITLIAANTPRAVELGTLGDPLPNVLRIDAPLIPNPQAAAGGAPSSDRVTVFLRVEVRALDAGGQQPSGPPLQAPVFPAQGPRS